MHVRLGIFHPFHPSTYRVKQFEYLTVISWITQVFPKVSLPPKIANTILPAEPVLIRGGHFGQSELVTLVARLKEIRHPNSITRIIQFILIVACECDRPQNFLLLRIHAPLLTRSAEYSLWGNIPHLVTTTRIYSRAKESPSPPCLHPWRFFC